MDALTPDIRISKSSRSFSPSQNPMPKMANKPWNAATFSADEIAMSRCKSPVGSSGSIRVVRHERGGSADTGLIRPDNLSSYASSEEPNPCGNNEDDGDLFYSYGGYNGAELADDSDGTKTRAAMDHVRSKIVRTKDLIRSEQTARDDNVNEYLKLASNADKQQLARIKSIFEKKNQKSAVGISQLQKKLEGYNKRLKDLETHGLTTSHHLKQPKEMLRDVGHGLRHVGGNIRDGISGLSGSVMSKPREFAHLIRNKFGSADNINSISRSSEADLTEDNSDKQSGRNHHGSATLPGGVGLHATTTGAAASRSEDGASECSSVTSESIPPRTGPGAPPPPASATTSLEPVWAELDHLRSKMEHIKQLVSKDIASLNHSLQEERFRTERLEEQINDLTELHQNEVENLKQTITDMEEKVQYQSEERLRDIHEMLEACQTKMSKMEHQQAQHQQYVTLEGLDNSNARALVVKLINVLLTVLQVVLLLVATFAGILMPFLRTRLRIITTTAVVAGLFIAVKQWPDSVSLSDYLIKHGKQALLSVK
ncbi:transmembrane and coiled-coil domains protein 2 [Myzus persicae]|uniref:transmembrane and coiled-coil domains protein 2 n=1 Tax=Myzus persicae TaxID=13164 RepID=UPI000B9382F0|nr:transmembrane and coiled-coil domains protein 2 [Myzus persicae]